MASIPSSSSSLLSLQLASPFPLSSSSSKFSLKPHIFHNHNHFHFHLITTRAQTDPGPSEPEPDPPAEPSDEEFENRINQLRVRYKSGTGKKAERRKGRKSKVGSSSGSGVYLPPVPLKEPVSGGLKVDFGFSSYSERLNGRIAILGLTALVLVELATGKGVINYHTPAIVLIQIYFVAAVAALYVKYEKEKISVWPDSSSTTK